MQESSDAVEQSGGESSRLDAETSDDGSQIGQNSSEADAAVADESTVDDGETAVLSAGSETDTINDQNEQAKDEQVNESGMSDEDRAES